MNLVSDKTGSNLGLFRPRERLANTYKMEPDETPLASVTGSRKKELNNLVSKIFWKLG